MGNTSSAGDKSAPTNSPYAPSATPSSERSESNENTGQLGAEGARLRAPAYRNPKYLDFIREAPCTTCGKPPRSQAAHVRILGGGGVGLKPSDYRTLPLCGACHGEQHRHGERSFWDFYQRDPAFLVLCRLAFFVKDKRRAIEALELIAEMERAG